MKKQKGTEQAPKPPLIPQPPLVPPKGGNSLRLGWYKTYRNDEVPFYSHVSRHCEVRSNPETFPKGGKEAPSNSPEGRAPLNPPEGGKQPTLGIAKQGFSCVSSPLSFGEGGGRGEKKAPPSNSPSGGEQPPLRLVQIRKAFKPSLSLPFGGTKGGLSFREGRGRGISGLLRRSYLTARNDDVPFYSHVSRHCEVRSNPETFPKGGLSLLFILLFCVCCCPLSAQTRYYVSTTGTPTGNALSWATANNDLQFVINNTQKGDTIWVAQGTYLPIRPADSLHKIDSNNRNNAFTITKNIALYGGFTGTETALSQRLLPLQGSNGLTILSGNIGNPHDSSDNAYHVVLVATWHDTARIDGFTITEGFCNEGYNMLNVPLTKVNGINTWRICGTGIYNVSSTLIASHLTATNNMGYAAIYCQFHGYTNPDIPQMHTNLTLTHSIVSDNKSRFGGAAGVDFIDEGDLYIFNSTITRNGILYPYKNGGGGISIDGPNTCILDNVQITENKGVYGGGIYISFGIFTKYVLWNNVLIANNSGDYGGGILVSLPTVDSIQNNFTITNSTLVNNNNTSTTYNVIYFDNTIDSTIRFRNCIIWGNTRWNQGTKQLEDYNILDYYRGVDSIYINSYYRFQYVNCLKGPTFDPYTTSTNRTPPPGAFIADPLFVDTANRDYHLQCGSPAVNMGYNACYNSGNVPDISYITTDLDGNPRFFNNGTVDLGCYELQSFCHPFIVLPEDTVMCEGDSIDIPIFISGEPPYTLVYTAKGKQDTLKNIHTNPYRWRVSPQDTMLYVFTYIQDRYYDSIISDSIRIFVLHPPKITAFLTNDTLCSGQQTRFIQFINTTDSCYWEAKGDSIKNIPLGRQKGNFGIYTVENKDSVLRTATIKVETFAKSNINVCYGDTGNFSITVRPVIELQAGVNDSLFCEGDSILFVLFNPENAGDIDWQQASGEFSDTVKNPIIANAKPSHTGLYIVRSHSSSYCVVPDTVQVTVLSAVITNMEDTLLVCDWEDVVISSNALYADKYQWNTGETTADIQVTEAGIYVLEASNERCSVLDTIVVMQINVSDFEIVSTGDLCKDGKVTLTAKIENVSYQWSTGDTTQTISVSAEGLYTVFADAGACKSHKEIEIVCPCSLQLPNFFSPNGDGFNDEYIPIKTFELHSFSMIIYDRWGNVMYQTDEFTPWNGKNKNGRNASAGVYYCVIEYCCKDNPTKKYAIQSSVTLVR